jgi:hypothetical protein
LGRKARHPMQWLQKARWTFHPEPAAVGVHTVACSRRQFANSSSVRECNGVADIFLVCSSITGTHRIEDTVHLELFTGLGGFPSPLRRRFWRRVRCP